MKYLAGIFFVFILLVSLDLDAQYPEEMNQVNRGYDPTIGNPVFESPFMDQGNFGMPSCYDLSLDCNCQPICLGWFTPGETFVLTGSEEERSCVFVVKGEKNQWTCFTGTFNNRDRDVKLKNIRWEVKNNNVWEIVQGTDGTDFSAGYRLNDRGYDSRYGYKYFRVYPKKVQVYSNAKGWYRFSAVLRASYNF